jgi:hypothetical protein
MPVDFWGKSVGPIPPTPVGNGTVFTVSSPYSPSGGYGVSLNAVTCNLNGTYLYGGHPQINSYTQDNPFLYGLTIDSSGSTLYQKTYYTPAGSNYYTALPNGSGVKNLATDSLGNIWVAHLIQISIYEEGCKVCITKISPLGIILNQYVLTISGILSTPSHPSIAIDPDDNIYIAGGRTLTKIVGGTVSWVKTVGEEVLNVYQVMVDSYGQVFSIAYPVSYSSAWLVLTKHSPSSGDMLDWQTNTYGPFDFDNPGNMAFHSAAKIDLENNIVVATRIFNYDYSQSFVGVIRYSGADGSIINQYEFNDPDTILIRDIYTSIYDIVYVCGQIFVNTSRGAGDGYQWVPYLCKLSYGTIQWQKQFVIQRPSGVGEFDPDVDFNCISVDPDGNVWCTTSPLDIGVGSSYDNALVFKTPSDGDVGLGSHLLSNGWTVVISNATRSTSSTSLTTGYDDPGISTYTGSTNSITDQTVNTSLPVTSEAI